MPAQVLRRFGIWRTTYDGGPTPHGGFFYRKALSREQIHVGNVDEKEVTEESRPDWGVYHPIVTLPALERYIRKAGLVPETGPNQQWSYGFIPQ